MKVETRSVPQREPVATIYICRDGKAQRQVASGQLAKPAELAVTAGTDDYRESLRRWSAALFGVPLLAWQPDYNYDHLFMVLRLCAKLLRDAPKADPELQWSSWALRLKTQAKGESAVYEFEIQDSHHRVTQQHESKFMAILLGCREIMSRAKLPSE